jgi:transposase
MYSIQQESLFSLSDLLEISPKDAYGYLFETLDINPFLGRIEESISRGTDSA